MIKYLYIYLCNPNRAAFLGDAPITLVDLLNQQKRWAIGLLEVVFSKFSPLNFGIRSMGLLMGLAYAHIGMWAFWPIPITIYAFLPQLMELAYFQWYICTCTYLLLTRARTHHLWSLHLRGG
jgi:cellulose synthase/poly-beta-1,6-N-acetylglucosamine synthase-like glycosyltransferase